MKHLRAEYWFGLLVCVWCGSASQVSAHTIEFETTRVTTASLTLSPDGQTLVFTMLGHLFRLPSTGGLAEQLTFGPYYDDDPTFSPDGSQIAFTSDRDGSAGNIFRLSLNDSRIVQLTREEFANHPTWNLDSKSVLYFRHPQGAGRGQASVVCRVTLQGERTEVLSTVPKRLGSTFGLRDGRLAWSVIEQDTEASREVTRIEALDVNGKISSVKTIPGAVDRVLVSRNPDGLYCHRKLQGNLFTALLEDLIFIPMPNGQEKQIIPVSSLGRFALSTDEKLLYVGDQGRLWKVFLPSGSRKALDFKAHVKAEVQEISKPGIPGFEHGLRSILTPRLSPDGRTLVFGAAGFLWQQTIPGGKAERLSKDTALEGEPAFSPDGRQLAFVHSEHGRDSVRLLDLSAHQNRVLTSGTSISELAWSSDGQRLVAMVTTGFEQRIMAFDVKDGKSAQLVEIGSWSPRPQLSADGKALYYSSDSDGVGNLYRSKLSKDAKPEQITHLTRHLSDARISPDETRVVFRRNRSILTASLTNEVINDATVHQLSDEGGDSFAITPDGLSVIYAVGSKIWLQPLAGGARHEVPVELQLSRPVAPALLLRGARVLDFVSGSFGPPTSLLVENGRLQWIGDDKVHSPPEGITVLDATGRFVIPGLFDMHVHSVGANEEAFLAYGVTSVRDPGGWLAWLNALQDRSEITSLPLPRYFYSGEIFEGEHPYWADAFLQLQNEEDARNYVRRFKQLGAGFIKVYPSLSWPLRRIVAEEAHRVGLPLVGHGMSAEEIVKSVTLGFLSVEHSPTPDPGSDDILQLLASSGTRWDPTIAVVAGDSLLLRDQPERLAEPRFAAFTPAWYLDFALSSGYNKPLSTPILRGILSAQLAGVRRAHELGARVLVGTDSPNPECFYGSSLHWEMERFVQAGLSPVEVLRLATEEAATAVGAPDLGTLSPGKIADLVVLNANPLQDIRNSEAIWRVIKGGWVFDPEALKDTSSDHRVESTQAK